MSARAAPVDRSRWIVGVMLLALVVAAAYVLHRAWVLRVDQWDAFLYLNNTRRFLGVATAHYQLDKPPLVPALYMPLVHHTRFEAANLAMLVGPHLQAALLSFLSMGAVFFAFRNAMGWRFALAGTVLMVGNAVFVRYAPLTLTDTVSAGLTAASFACWLVARRQRRFRWFIACGLCIGLAAITRYQLVMLPFALAFAEVFVSIGERRVHDRRWLGLAIASALSGAFFLYAHKVAFEAIDREWGARSLLEAIEYAGAGAQREWPHEEPWHYFQMLGVVVSPLVHAGAILGAPIALWRRRPRDFLFASWLLFLAGPLFRVDHNEVRYLYAAFPALIYFALLPVEELLALDRVKRFAQSPRGAATLTVAAAVALGVAVWPGIDQARRDVSDPFFEEGVILASSRWLVERNDEDLPYWWYGSTHTLHPRDVYRLRHDEFFNVFNFGPHEFEYFTGHSMPQFAWRGEEPVRPTIRHCPDGCAVLVGTFDDWNTRELIEHGSPDVPVQTLIVHRPVRLEWADDAWTGGGLRLTPGEEREVVAHGEALGEVALVVQRQGSTARTPAAVADWTPGEPIALVARPGDTVLVYRLERALFPRRHEAGT